MSETYKLEQTTEEEIADENKRIEITETKNVTNKQTISVSGLKQRHESILNEIQQLKESADEIVDQINAINTDSSLNITITDIPVKLIK